MTTVDLDPVDELDTDDDEPIGLVRYDVTEVIERHGSATAAERLGVSMRTVQRWIRNGVDEFTADRIACRLDGKHPGNVWGRDWA